MKDHDADRTPPETFEGVRWTRDPDDPHRFEYLPGDPRPSRDSDGSPAASLMLTGDTGMLAVTSRWHAPQRTLDRLAEHLAERFEVPREVVQLAPAPVRVREALLELVEGGGEPEVLARSNTSGAAPYSAAFSATLRGEQLAAVRSAMEGEPDLARIRYVVEADRPVDAEASIRGEIAGGLGEASYRTPEAAKKAVEEALASGDLRLEVTADDDAPESLRDRVVREARERAAEALTRPGERSGEERLDVRVQVSARVPRTLEPTTDLATWIEPGRSAEHVTGPTGGGGGARPPPPGRSSA